MSDFERQTKEVFEGIAGFYRFKNVHSMPPEDGVLWPSGVLKQFLRVGECFLGRSLQAQRTKK